MEVLRAPRSPRRVRREGTRIFWALALSGSVVVPAAGALWQRSRLLLLGYRIEQAQAETARLEDENRRLLAERAALRSLPRVESEARARLGLGRPADGQVVFVVEEPAP